MGNSLALLLMQIIIIGSLLVVIIYMVKYNIAINNEKRVARYSIEPVKTELSSIYDIVIKHYFKLVKKLRKPVKMLFSKLAVKYEKYVYNDKTTKPIDFITHKLIISISFVLLTVFALVLQNKVISLFQVIICFIFGFYILDIVLVRKEKKRKKEIENNMLRAIIIMNNAFKSGKSILQALAIAAEELPEPINHEFSKMHKDMLYGLSVDMVFERFAKRVDIEESRYLSSSLIILNKTGGNIIKVFSSIEKTLFDRKKLREEQKNLTAASNMIVKVLLFIPFIFVSIIYLLSPDYFNVFFESFLGYIILGMIIIMFALYIWFLKKI